MIQTKINQNVDPGLLYLKKMEMDSKVHKFDMVGDDGCKTRMLVKPMPDGRWQLCRLRAKSEHAVGQSPFLSPAMAERWARQAFMCGEKFE